MKNKLILFGIIGMILLAIVPIVFRLLVLESNIVAFDNLPRYLLFEFILSSLLLFMSGISLYWLYGRKFKKIALFMILFSIMWEVYVLWALPNHL